jgi:alkanesulfonate monooxygenase SsuD/methylene tetrahydromethanopterin reductase-like flavin-dependent oxidoreductase (luciferase family)
VRHAGPVACPDHQASRAAAGRRPDDARLLICPRCIWEINQTQLASPRDALKAQLAIADLVAAETDQQRRQAMQQMDGALHRLYEEAGQAERHPEAQLAR